MSPSVILGTLDVGIDNVQLLNHFTMQLSKNTLTSEFPVLSRNRSTDQNNPFNEDREATSTLLVY